MSEAESGLNLGANYPRWFVWFLRLFLVVVIVAGALRTYHWLMDTATTHERRKSGERAAIVEVKPLRRETKQVTLRATGSVIPVRELSLRARVGGEVIEVHPELEPGGRLCVGDVVLRLDQADYKLALSQAEASHRDAGEQLKQIDVQEANYRESLTIAKRSVELSEAELERLGALLRSKTVTQSAHEAQERAVLALRSLTQSLENSLRLIPSQRAAVQAKLDQAQSQVERARLDLERTVIRCPYNAVVTAPAVTVGAQVNTQTELARLVDVDAFWVEVPLRPGRLDWIALPNGQEPGAAAVVRPSGANGGHGQWRGTVVRRQASIEEKGRLAHLLVRVERPLEPGGAPLLLGSFVHVELEGPLLENVFVIPRDTLRNGQEAWLLNREGRLEVRPVAQLWSDDEVIVVRDGLAEGERLVLTDIASPVPGMKLDLPEEAAKKNSEEAMRGGGPGLGQRQGPPSPGGARPGGPPPQRRPGADEAPRTKGGAGNG